jgi:hypothetical protein
MSGVTETNDPVVVLVTCLTLAVVGLAGVTVVVVVVVVVVLVVVLVVDGTVVVVDELVEELKVPFFLFFIRSCLYFYFTVHKLVLKVENSWV